jgi:methionyl aminopeptidase
MIALKTPGEIDAIAAAGSILARVLEEVAARVAPGVSTAELDAFAEALIRSHPGAEPAFKGLYDFPASLCTSVNHEVVHGIPSQRRLEEGDIISVDAGVRLDGWYADMAVTVPVGEVDDDALHLLDITKQALAAGIHEARAGNRIGDIGSAVQRITEASGFSVVRELVGHGLGREPHEEPQVPNYGRAGRGLRLHPGLVVAIEPMVNEGVSQVRTLADRWTVVTVDRKRSAHFEHTVAVTEAGPRILTDGGGPAAAARPAERRPGAADGAGQG